MASSRMKLARPRPSWAWQDDSACRGEDLVLFFGPDGERQPERDVRERKAKAVCSQCPVRAACLDYALSRNEKTGLWGGLSEDERASERRRRMRRGASLAEVSVLPGFKRCRACRETKSVKEFSRNAKHFDGLSMRCRACIQKSRKPTWARSDEQELEAS
ncbi:WhiB family transcriptional regulator [Nonomuraea basaltis]|nr:WhiB family transcriptional regulator [Nonomuraea basaltis]TMS00131.1 WhiB family transcriptional regulator [Nonomuraea basaltis]